MLNALRRASSLPVRRTATDVCTFCEKQPITTSQSLGFRRHVATATATHSPKPPPPELIKEIRSEIEAHRESLRARSGGHGAGSSGVSMAGGNWKGKEERQTSSKKKKKDLPKAPKVRRRKSGKASSDLPMEYTGRTKEAAKSARSQAEKICAEDYKLNPIVVPNQPVVPALSHDLDRVLFNPGVYFLQDPRSKVYNFDPYLQKIMPVNEFDFESLSDYIVSSRDTRLEALAREMGKKYVGSTSSMTSILAHFHYLLSSWRSINPSVISKNFVVPWKTFTALQRAPQAVFLRWKDGVYAVDPDKEFDKESVLTLLGKSMEKLLTLPPETFEKYRRTNEPRVLSELGKPVDTYHYSTLGDFLMRSQLDAFDPRLPGTGMFDLKTRAVVSIRMDVENFHIGSGYQIKDRFGEWESFEREYFDMIRAAFLKYSLQVRMGRMDGIFVAFHNTERIFGFQYITLEEMDAAIHQDWHSGIGDREFKLSLRLLNDIFDKATKRFPEQSLRIHFETRETQTPLMYVFAEPVKEDVIAEIQESKRVDLTKFLKELGERKAAYLASISDDGEGELEARLEADETFSEEADQTEGVSAANPAGIETAPTSAEQAEADSSETDSESSGSDSDGESEPELSLEAGIEANLLLDATAADPPAADAAVNPIVDPASDPTLVVRTSDEEEPDEEWLKEIAKQQELNLPPENSVDALLAFTLKIKNYVNGRLVLRPDQLKADDKWEVQYELEEIVGPRAWSTYKACQRRRQNWLSTRREADDGSGADGTGPGGGFKDAYIRHLREMSLRGRQYLNQVEKEEAMGEKIVWSGSYGRKEKPAETTPSGGSEA